MKKYITLLPLIVAFIMVSACGNHNALSTSNDSISAVTAETVESNTDNTNTNITETAETMSEPVTTPADIYEQAMELLDAGDTKGGLELLCEISDYYDAEYYLVGYESLKCLLGTWVADFSSEFTPGTTMYPMNMTINCLPSGFYVDDISGDGYYRVHMDVHIKYTYYENNAVHAAESNSNAFMTIREEGATSLDQRIAFGDSAESKWFNLLYEDNGQAYCMFETSDNGDGENFVENSFNTFYCNKTENVELYSLYWNKSANLYIHDTSAELPEEDNDVDDTTLWDEEENVQNTIAGTSSQNSALLKALSYLSVSAFSHDGLVEQLEYEGYSHADAVYGADSCGADWDEQALLKAQSYLDCSAFSYSGLIEQLKYESFTAEQAEYGVEHCGADWNEQAAKKAKSYMSLSGFSQSDLVDQLEFEGFTRSQAVYGAAHYSD